MNSSKKTFILVEGAMLIALATVLSYLKIYELPQGGSITIEALPLVVMGLRHGPKWGVGTAFVHGLIQMIIGFSNVMYCNTIGAMILCILLDYLVAFSVLGLASVFAKLFRNRVIGATVGAVICSALRFVCSFLSGWILWGSWAPEGMHPAYYSLTYNGSYMLPNTVIIGVVVAILAKTLPAILFNEGSFAVGAKNKTE